MAVLRPPPISAAESTVRATDGGRADPIEQDPVGEHVEAVPRLRRVPAPVRDASSVRRVTALHARHDAPVGRRGKCDA